MKQYIWALIALGSAAQVVAYGVDRWDCDSIDSAIEQRDEKLLELQLQSFAAASLSQDRRKMYVRTFHEKADEEVSRLTREMRFFGTYRVPSLAFLSLYSFGLAKFEENSSWVRAFSRVGFMALVGSFYAYYRIMARYSAARRIKEVLVKFEQSLPST